jgi:small-conductance mechanosensitive channel
MKISQSLVALGLLTLLALAAAGLFLTRDTGEAAQGKPLPGHRAPLVDEEPIQTARSIAKLASSWEEQRLAQQALKLADHEVDLAFADALRDAAEKPIPATAESRQLYGRLSKAQAQLKDDQDRADQVKKQLEKARGERQDNLQQQMSIVQAQIELDQDELDDAKGDLIRSGVDPLTRIQRQFNRYRANQQNDGNRLQPVPNSAAAAPPGNSLVHQFVSWRTLQNKLAQLVQAQNVAAGKIPALSEAHDALEKQVNAEQGDQQAITQEATSQLASGQGGNGQSGETAAALVSLHVLSVDQKNLADLDRRVQDQSELHDTYGSWIALLRVNQRAVEHSIIKAALWVVLIVLLVYLAGRVTDRLLTDPTPGHTRFRTLRMIIRFALQAIGVLLILFVLFGTPTEMPTILGLATAGLTVALKDFVIAFVGWFVLMGRNGVRAGDWVEINGVVGEVLEVSLLRTVLLETGNWTDTGHPTGRKVAFMNSFAIEGHFFNFSTVGQWLWDELQIMVPSDRDPYPIIEAIQKLVTKETEADAKLAEQEWQRATSRYRVRAVSATPAVNLRPMASGVEVHIRYITRAHERYATRARLYQALVDLLQRRGVEPAAAVVPIEVAKA